MNDSKQADECGEKRLSGSMNCNRNAGHGGDHGYGGVFWPKVEPPAMPVNSVIFCVMAVRNGEFFAAPLGTPTDLDASEAWLRISSLADLGALLGVRS